ncbi:MAG: glycosyltransferase family 87 protein [Candidatus Limnocylindrales bacterium]
MLAIAILAVAGGLIVAFIYARGELAGSDAFAYWTAVQRWLAGEDMYQVIPGLYIPPSEGALPYAYAPWSLYLFVPWGLLPWDVAWVVWRAANLVLFTATVLWAYDRRPLATALIVALLGPSIAANFDTGNINVFIALSTWAAFWVGPRLGGTLWALGTALKFLPAFLLFFTPRPAWRYGLMALGVFVILTLATWPHTIRQLEIVLNYPRPLRIDYMILAWGAVPWLFLRSWPPRLSREWLLAPPREQ